MQHSATLQAAQCRRSCAVLQKEGAAGSLNVRPGRADHNPKDEGQAPEVEHRTQEVHAATHLKRHPAWHAALRSSCAFGAFPVWDGMHGPRKRLKQGATRTLQASRHLGIAGRWCRSCYTRFQQCCRHAQAPGTLLRFLPRHGAPSLGRCRAQRRRPPVRRAPTALAAMKSLSRTGCTTRTPSSSTMRRSDGSSSRPSGYAWR